MDAGNRDQEPAGIQYHGVAGSSADCREAVERLLQTGVPLTRARIVTHGRRHALILTTDIGDPIAIKSGFSSGYGGEGPTAFSFVLQLLQAASVEIDEREASADSFDRLNQSALMQGEFEELWRGPAQFLRPWSDYILDRHFEASIRGELWQDLPPVLPFGLLDPRLAPLAGRFWSDPDALLNQAYRRLEDSVRRRTGLKGIGQKLFNAAFLGPKAKLTWVGHDEGELQGRGQLFGAIYLAYRNPRAHQEAPRSNALSELLLLNHLFRLEAEAVEAPSNQEDATASGATEEA